MARIALVKPDKARAVENMILAAAQRGQITERVGGAAHSSKHSSCAEWTPSVLVRLLVQLALVYACTHVPAKCLCAYPFIMSSTQAYAPGSCLLEPDDASAHLSPSPGG